MTMLPPPTAQYYYQGHQQLIHYSKCNNESLDPIHSCYLNDDDGIIRSSSSASDHIVIMGDHEEDKLSSSSNNNNNGPEADQERDHEQWLQLSIGGGGGGGTQHQMDTTRSRRSLPLGGGGRGGGNNLVELDLLNPQQQQHQQQQQHHFIRPPPPSLPMFNMPGFRVPTPSFTMSLLLQQQQQGPTASRYNNMMTTSSSFGANLQEMGNWALRPTANFSSNLVPRSGPYNSYNVQGGPSSEVRLLIDPPRTRPHSGIWFMLQASQFQGREPYLPQISKSYLRIKDGRMTVRLIMKYVANKLRLDTESEVEITCRGQHLVPFLTLQHVRDNIWLNQRDTTTTTTLALLPHSSTEDHVMVLRYGRPPNNLL